MLRARACLLRWYAHRDWRRRIDWLGYVLLAPAILILVSVLIGPLLYSLVLSFFEYNLLRPEQTAFMGLQNYARLVQSPSARQSLLLTLLFVAVTVPVEVVLGTVIALILNRSFRGNRLLRTLMLLPMMVSEVVAALSWKLLFHSEFGLANYILSVLGFEKQVWLGPGLAMASVMIVEVWQHTPFVTLVTLAGLQSLPKDVLEAATVDGASGLRQLKYVVLPLLKPIVLVALVFRTMFTLRVFTPVWVLTAGGPADSTLVIGVNIYRTAFRYYDFGMASTLSWLLVVVTLAITMVYMLLLRRESLA